MFAPAVNVSDQAVLVDAEGHTVGGQEWTVVDTEAPEVRVAAEAGLLHVHLAGFDDGPGQDEGAVAAARLAREANGRAQTISEMAPGDVHDVLAATEPVAGDTDPTVVARRLALAVHVELPATAAAPEPARGNRAPKIAGGK